MQPQILEPEHLTQIELLIEKVHAQPLFLRNLIAAATEGEDVPHFDVFVEACACCDYHQGHNIEGATLQDLLDDPGHQPKFEFLKNASIADLLTVRQRVLAQMRRPAVAA